MNNQSCIRCGISDGTICGRHYNGLRQHQLGKGRGLKCDDLFIADFCMHCDRLFTEGINPTCDGERAGKSVARSEEFLFYVCLTIQRRKNENPGF